jgi:hypothetical protein
MTSAEMSFLSTFAEAQTAISIALMSKIQRIIRVIVFLLFFV